MPRETPVATPCLCLDGKERISGSLLVNRNGPPAKEVGVADPGKEGTDRRQWSLPRRHQVSWDVWGSLERGAASGPRPVCGEQPPTPRSHDDCTVARVGHRVWRDLAREGESPPPLSPLMGSQGQQRELGAGMEPPKPLGFGMISLEV